MAAAGRGAISAEHTSRGYGARSEEEGTELTIEGLGGGLLCGRVLRGGGRDDGLGMAPRRQHAWAALKHGGKHRLEGQGERRSDILLPGNPCAALRGPGHNHPVSGHDDPSQQMPRHLYFRCQRCLATGPPRGRTEARVWLTNTGDPPLRPPAPTPSPASGTCEG